jgi:pyrophosphatase PpaX
MSAVLWDLDDTLIETVHARMRSLEYAYEQCVGGTVDGRGLWQSHRGGTIEALGQKLLGDNYRCFVDTYRRHYFEQPQPIAPYSGITAVLDTLLATGIPMLVVTSKISWGAIDELQRCGLLHYFHSVVGFDDTDEHKPKPGPIFEALDRLLLGEPDNVFFVGDSPADVHAARNAGCSSIGALWGTLEAGMLRDAGPDYMAEEPLDVLHILREELRAE